MKEILLSKYIKLLFETPRKTGSWFGYYNYDVLNHDQTKMLSNRTMNDAEQIKKGMTIDVGYYDIHSGEWHKVGESDSYNWPQGAMLQWMPGKGNENKVIYNTSNGYNNIAKIVDIITLEEKTIDWSIYALTPDGKKSISLLFERSHWCRAYHYESIDDIRYEGRIIDEDGIFEIDLENNFRRRIISIQDVIATDKEEYFDKAKHWLEHIMISPTGKRFCFLHRFTVDGLNDYETRLFVANIDGTHLQLVSGWRDFYLSHFGWNGDDHFVIYSYRSNKHHCVVNEINDSSQLSKSKTNTIQKQKILLKSIYHTLPSDFRKSIQRMLKGQLSYYQYYQISNANIKLIDCFDGNVFNIDGHPSFSNDGRYMITDTYPDSKGYQHIIIYNINSKKAIIVAKLFAGLNKRFGSCDLHPKLSKNNDYLVVDTAYDGQHHIILFQIDWIFIKDRIE